jgi:hypothetical protein
MLFTHFEDPERNLLEMCTEIQQINEVSAFQLSFPIN